MKLPKNSAIRVTIMEERERGSEYRNFLFRTYKGASNFIIKQFNFGGPWNYWDDETAYTDESCNEKVPKPTIEMATEKFSPENLRALKLTNIGDYKEIYCIWDEEEQLYMYTIDIRIVKVFHD